jgi:hypothetical protein
MTDNPKIHLLREMYEQGDITCELFEARLITLGVDPVGVFDQRGQQVGTQYNVKGNVYNGPVAAKPPCCVIWR